MFKRFFDEDTLKALFGVVLMFALVGNLSFATQPQRYVRQKKLPHLEPFIPINAIDGYRSFASHPATENASHTIELNRPAILTDTESTFYGRPSATLRRYVEGLLDLYVKTHPQSDTRHPLFQVIKLNLETISRF